MFYSSSTTVLVLVLAALGAGHEEAASPALHPPDYRRFEAGLVLVLGRRQAYSPLAELPVQHVPLPVRGQEYGGDVALPR